MTRSWTKKELQIVKDLFGDYAWHEYHPDPIKFIRETAKKLNRTEEELVKKIDEL
jgi:hypothetical protein